MFHFAKMVKGCKFLDNFQKFQKNPGKLEFWNSGLKIKLSDQNWVGKIPNMLKLVKNSNFQRISRFSGIWNLEIWKFWKSPKMPKINLQMTMGFVFLIIITKGSFWNIFTFLGKIGGRFQLGKTTNPILALFFN